MLVRNTHKLLSSTIVLMLVMSKSQSFDDAKRQCDIALATGDVEDEKVAAVRTNAANTRTNVTESHKTMHDDGCLKANCVSLVVARPVKLEGVLGWKQGVRSSRVPWLLLVLLLVLLALWLSLLLVNPPAR